MGLRSLKIAVSADVAEVVGRRLKRGDRRLGVAVVDIIDATAAVDVTVVDVTIRLWRASGGSLDFVSSASFSSCNTAVQRSRASILIWLLLAFIKMSTSLIQPCSRRMLMMLASS